jgi:hypothetical protein
VCGHLVFPSVRWCFGEAPYGRRYSNPRNFGGVWDCSLMYRNDGLPAKTVRPRAPMDAPIEAGGQVVAGSNPVSPTQGRGVLPPGPMPRRGICATRCANQGLVGKGRGAQVGIKHPAPSRVGGSEANDSQQKLDQVVDGVVVVAQVCPLDVGVLEDGGATVRSLDRRGSAG